MLQLFLTNDTMADLRGRVVKVGTRKSQLALIQTRTVIDSLKLLQPNVDFQIVAMTTPGDKIVDVALSKIGTKDLFTTFLDQALLAGEVDIAVHSLKDVPTRIPENVLIGAVYRRDSVHDAVVMHPKHKGKRLEDLDKNSVIGTCSLRRCAQLQREFPNFKFESLRGNLNTRLKKLDDDDKYDAIVLAEAGLVRMGWQDRVSQVLPPSICMYAISQGAMGVACREDDPEMIEMLSAIHDRDSALSCIAERAFMFNLAGGCSMPVSVYSTITDTEITLSGGVFSIDGSRCVKDNLTKSFPATDRQKAENTGSAKYIAVAQGGISAALCETAQAVGFELSNMVLQAGAATIIEEAREHVAANVINEAERKHKLAQAEEANRKDKQIRSEQMKQSGEIAVM